MQRKHTAAEVAVQVVSQHLRKDNHGAFSRRPYRDSRTGQNVWCTSQMANAFLAAKVVKVHRA